MVSPSISMGRVAAFPTALIGQAIPMLSRHDLEALTERLIERLDEMDGDCDRENDDPLEEVGDMELERDAWPTIGAQWQLGA